jgi:hypothetical protein
MNPILKLLALLIPCFTMAMSKHQKVVEDDYNKSLMPLLLKCGSQ